MSFEIVKQLKISLIFLITFSVLTGLVYPIFITVLAQAIFPWQANGSLIIQNGKTIGSVLIGQSFSDPKYFWGRPSATHPFAYNALHSSGSNMGPSNPAFLATVKNRAEFLKKAHPQNSLLVPVDLVTASGSGLDPEISPLAAFYQTARIATARNIPIELVLKLIQNSIKNRTFLILGEPRVNVLQLNLALDALFKEP